jgi:hypothetical protein
MKLSYLILLFILLTGCSDNEKFNSNLHKTDNFHGDNENLYTYISIKKDTIDIFAEKYIENLYSTSPYFNFDSVSLMGSFSINKYGIDSINFDDDTEIDTIITAIFNRDTLVYAKANSGIFLWKMRLHTDKIKIDHDIYISCLKQNIYNKFKIDNSCNNFIFVIYGVAEYFQYTIIDGNVDMIMFDVDFEGVN